MEGFVVAELTRMQKYAQLRESLANDKETSVSTKDLSDFENRFNTVTEQLSNVHSRPQDDNTSSDVLMQNNQEADIENNVENVAEALAEDAIKEDADISNNEESTDFTNRQLNGEPVVLDVERNEEPIIVEPADLSETPEEIVDDLLTVDDNNQEMIVEENNETISEDNAEALENGISEVNSSDNIQEETEEVIADVDSVTEIVDDINASENIIEDAYEEIVEDNSLKDSDVNQDFSLQENETIENKESIEAEESYQEETIEDVFDNNETDFDSLSQESKMDDIDTVSENLFEDNNADIADNQEDTSITNSDNLQENIENNLNSEDNEPLPVESEETSNNETNNENKENEKEDTVYDEAEINTDDFQLPSFDDLYFGDDQWQDNTEENSEQVTAEDNSEQEIAQNDADEHIEMPGNSINEETTSMSSYTDMFTAGDYDNVIHDTYDSYFDNLQSNNPTTEIPVLEESGNMETYTSEMPSVSDEDVLKQETKDDNVSSYLDEALNEADLYSRVNGENTVDKLAGNIIDEVRHNDAELDADQDSLANDMTGFIETPIVNNQEEINDSFKDTVTMEISKIMDEISANSFVNSANENEGSEQVEEDNDINSVVENTIPYLNNEDQKDAIEIKSLSELQENEANDQLSETIPFIVSEKENNDVEVIENSDGKNTVLNIILIVLIIILVAVLGLIVFYILKTQNII